MEHIGTELWVKITRMVSNLRNSSKKIFKKRKDYYLCDDSFFLDIDSTVAILFDENDQF